MAAFYSTATVVLLGIAGAALAVESREQPTERPGVAVAVPPLPSAETIGSLSDAELTALSVHWLHLSAEQRRVLLKTVRTRMARNSRTAHPASPLQPQRRFGRVVRKSNGEVVRIETHVYQSADGARGSISHRMTFGAGFEQRQRSAQEATAAKGATARAAQPARTATPPRQ